MQNLPYMGNYPQKVVGKDSTQPILFGVIGAHKQSNKYQALQQVVEHTPHGELPPTVSSTHTHMNTDKHLLGHPAKTHIPGIHYGMVPFAGRFMSQHGEIEVYDSRHHHEHAHHDKYDKDGEHIKEHHEHHHKHPMHAK